MRRIALAACLLSAGCTYDDDEYWPGCHWDCSGSIECVDGVIYGIRAEPIPCDRWTGSCPTTGGFPVAECERGCRRDGMTRLSWDPGSEEAAKDALCEERRPKTEGDSCTTDVDCLEGPSTDGGVPRWPILRCEPGSSTCIWDRPPAASDHLGPCAVDLTGLEDQAGAIPDDTCSTGWCIFDTFLGCTRHGCSSLCSEDWMCPSGSVCLTLRAHQVAPYTTDVCWPVTTDGTREPPSECR